MKIAIYSKFEMSGGSEFRGCELANGLQKFTSHKVTILVRGDKFPSRLKEYLNPDIPIVQNAMEHPDSFYSQDLVLIINSDSKEFTTTDYWDGKSATNGHVVELHKIKRMVFLFNFLISPSRYLNQIGARGPSIGIITTNTKFYDEVTSQDRYEFIRRYPRIRLESPIDPNTVTTEKTPSEQIRVGMHSKGLGNKWNDDIPYVIAKLNERYPELPFKFRFMGMSATCRKLIEKGKFKNAECLPENTETIKEFLASLDIFMFFPSWGREEPWARVVGEAMMSGCPVFATDKGGNKDQVLKYHNGHLNKRKDDFVKTLCHAKEHPETITQMGANSRRIAYTTFRTEKIIQRLADFVESM